MSADLLNSDRYDNRRGNKGDCQRDRRYPAPRRGLPWVSGLMVKRLYDERLRQLLSGSRVEVNDRLGDLVGEASCGAAERGGCGSLIAGRARLADIGRGGITN